MSDEFYKAEALKQIIDNQLILNKKIDILIKVMSDLTNTIIKYDNDYQNEIAKGEGQ